MNFYVTKSPFSFKAFLRFSNKVFAARATPFPARPHLALIECSHIHIESILIETG